MLPLIVIALGLGVALTAYEFSPRVHARVDAFARAIREAHAAHATADVHLANADSAVGTAETHAQAADVARQAPPQPAPPLPPMPPPPPSAPSAPTGPAPAPRVPTVPTPPPGPPGPLPPPVQTVAEAHDNAAQVATDAGVDHVAEAQAENQKAAEQTAEAAKNAKTEADRRAAVESARKVVEREQKIAQALASLGVGQCGVRTYTGVTSQVAMKLLSKLKSEGMGVVGDNPWNIDTHQYNVRLRAVWDPNTAVVKLIVTTGKGTEVIPFVKDVTCQDIWDKIDPIMQAAGARRG